LKGVLGVNYPCYGRKRFLQRKAGNENGHLFVSEMPPILRIPDTMVAALEEEGIASRRKRSRPGQVRESSRLHGSHRRYALLPKPALPRQIRDPEFANSSLYLIWPSRQFSLICSEGEEEETSRQVEGETRRFLLFISPLLVSLSSYLPFFPSLPSTFTSYDFRPIRIEPESTTTSRVAD
jgi:hypothetical protein